VVRSPYYPPSRAGLPIGLPYCCALCSIDLVTTATTTTTTTAAPAARPPPSPPSSPAARLHLQHRVSSPRARRRLATNAHGHAHTIHTRAKHDRASVGPPSPVLPRENTCSHPSILVRHHGCQVHPRPRRQPVSTWPSPPLVHPPPQLARGAVLETSPAASRTPDTSWALV